MGVRFNAPPGWPQPPEGWRPAPNWAPDPSWPLPPSDWEFWVRDDVAVSQQQHAQAQATAVAAQGVQGAMPAQMAPGHAAPGQMAAGQMVPGQFAPGQLQPGQLQPGQIPIQAGPGDVARDVTPSRRPSFKRRGAASPAQPAPEDTQGRGVVPNSLGSQPRWLRLAALAAVLGAAILLGVFLLRGGDDNTDATTAPTTKASATARASGSASTKASSSTSTGTSKGGPLTGNASAVLAGLPVRTEEAATPYSRSAFGSGWQDVDSNGCDTGNDVLRRDMTSVHLKPGSKCVVRNGRLLDRYIGRAAAFPTVSGKVAVDFIVPLADAWNAGAYSWTADQRVTFVNDQNNLIAVQAATATKKRSRNAADWLPSSVAYRCDYIARQIGIKAAYGLSVSQAEKAAMDKVLGTCADQEVPTGIKVPEWSRAATGSTSTASSGASATASATASAGTANAPVTEQTTPDSVPHSLPFVNDQTKPGNVSTDANQ